MHDQPNASAELDAAEAERGDAYIGALLAPGDISAKQREAVAQANADAAATKLRELNLSVQALDARIVENEDGLRDVEVALLPACSQVITAVIRITREVLPTLVPADGMRLIRATQSAGVRMPEPNSVAHWLGFDLRRALTDVGMLRLDDDPDGWRSDSELSAIHAKLNDMQSLRTTLRDLTEFVAVTRHRAAMEAGRLARKAREREAAVEEPHTVLASWSDPVRQPGTPMQR